jgi:hypothetical protein
MIESLFLTIMFKLKSLAMTNTAKGLLHSVQQQSPHLQVFPVDH